MARLERAFRRDSDFKVQEKQLVRWKGQALPSRRDDICPSVEMGEDRVRDDKTRKWAHLARTLCKMVTGRNLRKTVRTRLLALWARV